MLSFVKRASYLIAMTALLSPSYATASPITVYSNNFDSAPTLGGGALGGLSGVTTTESVQGYSAIPGFSGNFLRNTTGGSPQGTAGTATTLTLTNLPPHTPIDLTFLLP